MQRNSCSKTWHSTSLHKLYTHRAIWAVLWPQHESPIHMTQSELITALLLNQLLGSNYFTRKQETAEPKKPWLSQFTCCEGASYNSKQQSKIHKKLTIMTCVRVPSLCQLQGQILNQIQCCKIVCTEVCSIPVPPKNTWNLDFTAYRTMQLICWQSITLLTSWRLKRSLQNCEYIPVSCKLICHNLTESSNLHQAKIFI
jgi:hypothetical protein